MEDKIRDEAKQKFQNELSEIMIDLLDKTYESIAIKYGKDVAFGYVLGIYEVHFALTSKTIKEVMNNGEE